MLMLRGGLLLIVLLALAGALGYGVSLLMHVPPHSREMIFAAVSAAVSSTAGMAMFIVSAELRADGSAGGQQAAQMGLAATVVHLLGCLMLGAVVMLGKVASPVPMLLWLLPMYWAALIAQVWMIVRCVKASAAMTN